MTRGWQWVVGVVTAVAVHAEAHAGAGSPSIEVVVSPAGVEAWLHRDSTLPIVSLAFRFAGGAALDPPGKEGLTQFMTALLDEGAGPHDSETFRDRLDDRAIRLTFSSGRDSVRGRVLTLSENIVEAATLLGHALAEPRFDEEPVSRIRNQLEASRAQRANHPGSVGQTRWMGLVFGDGPYGRPPNGTRASLQGMTASDLAAAARERLVRSRLVVGVVGDIDPESLARVLDIAFGDLPQGLPLADEPESGAFDGQTAYVPMDVPQTQLVFGLPGLPRDDPDFFPAVVLNAILGGGAPGARLEQALRVERGLTYGVHTYLAAADRSPLLMGGMATQEATAAEAVDVIRSEIQRVATDGVTPEELANAKLYLTGSFPLQLDSTAEVAGYLVGMQEDALGLDYLARRNDLVDSVSLDDIERVAEKLLVADRITWVAVGRSNPFRIP